MTERIYGDQNFRFSETSEAVFVTSVGANGADETSFTNPLPIAFGDSGSLGPFGWLRTAPPSYVFDAQLTYDLQPLLFEQIATATGGAATITHDSTNRNAVMTFTAATTGSKAYMQQYEHNRYQPGRGQAALITGNFIEHKANCLKFLKYGIGEAGNGVALESNGTGYQVTLYSDTAEGDQTVLQADWDDPLNGTGRSGLTLQISKGVIFFLDMQSLYYGRVRVCVDIDGIATCFHEFKNANVLAKPYIQTANLPISAGMTCTGTVTTTMNFTCCTVLSEGGQEDVGGFPFTARGAVTAASGTATPLVSVRPRTTFNSITNRSVFRLESIDLAVTGSNAVDWDLCLGQALTTPTWANVNATYSAMEYTSVAGTANGAPGLIIQSGSINATATSKGAISTRVPMKYPITLDAAGAVRLMGTLTLNVTGVGGTSTCRGSLNWKELR